MNQDILLTKLQIPPQRPSLVARPHLWAQLDKGLRGKWTLISAPAGFGKTVLVSSWAAKKRLPVAWVSLDKSDNDPGQYWLYLFTALDQIGMPTGVEAFASFQPSQTDSISQQITSLINNLVKFDGEIILIMDDYHLIDAVDIQRQMIFLLDHLPPQLHLYLISRSDPPLPLSRYRAGAELVELRTADLRFSAAETAIFLAETMQLNLKPAAVRELKNHTEGWVAGLQMAALSLQQHPDDQADAIITAFSGSHRYILDYLTDEVLREQPERVGEFLLGTAVLDRLCGPLCDAVLETTCSQTMLEELEKANLFLVPLDEKREWFRYHHLFADLLRKRLGQRQPEYIAALHFRASCWFAGKGLANEAISHALAAGHEDWRVELVEQHILQAIFRSEFSKAGQWLAALPAERIQASPILCLAQAWNSLHYNTPEQTEQYADAAQSALSAHHQTDPNLVNAHIETLQTVLARTRGESPQMQIELAQQALAVIPDTEIGLRSMIAFRVGLGYLDLGAETEVDKYLLQAESLGRQSGTIYAFCGAVYIQALMAQRRGQLRDTVALCHRTLDSMSESERELPIAGIIPIFLGLVFAEWNELTEAEAVLHQGLNLVANGGFHEVRIKGEYALARLQLARQQSTSLPELVPLAAPFNQNLISYAAALETRLQLLAVEMSGDGYYLDKAVRWAAKQTFQVETAPDADWRILAHLTHARVLLAQHRAGDAVDLRGALQTIQQQLLILDHMGWQGIRLEALLTVALLFQALGQEENAMLALARTLTLAESEGYKRIFLDEGQPMAHLLYALSEAGNVSDYVAELLAAFATEMPVTPAQSVLIEPLTPREVEVLHLIADGRTNQEIGQQLCISLGTVKRHTANINGKLDVHNRTQAVARARTLGILTG